MEGVVTGDSGTRVLLAVICGATTYDEMVAITHLNRSSVHRHLKRLQAWGLVTWEPDHKRTLRSAVRVAAWTPPPPRPRRKRLATITRHDLDLHAL